MKIKRVLRWIGIIAGALLFLLLAAAGSIWWALHASLAQLDGQRSLPGLQTSVQIERDGLGVPTIHATNRLDATRALGFLHGQDRFFQMDLARRAGGGELSELFGAIAIERDREQRIHRPRARARQAVAQARPEEAALLKAYAEGVNAGLKALRVRPPEYLLLRTHPAPWQLEDTFLVACAMFGDLHDIDGNGDYREAVLRKALSPAAVAFFNSPDTLWSAALDGSEITAPPIPTSAEFSVDRPKDQASSKVASPPLAENVGIGNEVSSDADKAGTIGSNNWAVDGRRSGTGAAIVANDMHLGLNVPNTWYRVRLIYRDPEVGEQDVTGVTLPGTPVVVSGSNRYVAWGNTASDLDITDLVSLEFDAANSRRYLTPAGWRDLESFTETIQVHNEASVNMTVDETIWGPVVNRGGTAYALATTMHDPQAVNLGLIQVERSRNLQEALHAANLSGTPVNNFVVGDRSGQIGYSLLGRLPNRFGFDGITPCSWADGTRGWKGWLAPHDYPQMISPTNGVLWTANNRILGSPGYNVLHTSPDNGARARQIRDDLLAMDKASEKDLWTIYRDDRARFLEPWQKLMLPVLEACSATNADWRQAKELVSAWGGRAAVESQGYRLVRAFRAQAMELLFAPVNQRISQFDGNVQIHSEDAAWVMLRAKPVHLLNPKFTSYDALLGVAINQILADLKKRNISLVDATWGARNRLQIQHPISHAVPQLSRWLDMPDAPIPGDSHMPKVHVPGFGSSERMIVSPGHEEAGLYNMPCGESGHFLSPFYRDEMAAWAKVEPQPFLPGTKQHDLVLVPVTASAEN